MYEPDPGKKYYSQTGKTVNTRNFSGMLNCTAREKPVRREKTEAQARTLVCGFVASSRVLIFAVIGRNRINILEIFQVFIVFPVTL